MAHQPGHAPDTGPEPDISEEELRERLIDGQISLRENGLGPVLLLVGGLESSGRGEVVSALGGIMDNRYVRVEPFGPPSPNDAVRPLLARVWAAMPPRGEIGIHFNAWYGDVLDRLLAGKRPGKTDRQALDRLVRFERQMAAEGITILKIWLHLEKKEQAARLKELRSSPATRWRVSERDRWQLKHYDQVHKAVGFLHEHTKDSPFAWTVIPGADEKARDRMVAEALLATLEAHLQQGAPPVEPAPLPPRRKGHDLTVSADPPLDKEPYKEELDRLQQRLAIASRSRRIAKRGVVLLFEGVDAAGKGGVIRRIAQALDPRHYRVIPVAAPSVEENRYPWAWRFWTRLPGAGRFAIFDRSWYGRVVVERVEGFADPVDWQRAYGEINDFEADLAASGQILIKFWLQISKEEQLRRFEARKARPWKRYKITDEDWRNRDRWDDNQQAVADMLALTHTRQAPWNVVATDDKRRARLAVLSEIVRRLESR